MLNPKHVPWAQGSAESLAHGTCSEKHLLINTREQHRNISKCLKLWVPPKPQKTKAVFPWRKYILVLEGTPPSLPDGSGVEPLTRGQNFLLAGTLDGTFWTLLVSSSWWNHCLNIETVVFSFIHINQKLISVRRGLFLLKDRVLYSSGLREFCPLY